MHRILVFYVFLSFLIAHGDDSDSHSHDHENRPSKNKAAKSGSIKGVVIDSQTGEYVIGAEIFIKSFSSDKIITGGTSDKDGFFRFTDIARVRCKAEIRFIGYETQIIDDINLTPTADRQRDLGLIPLVPTSLEGEEVSVIDSMPTVEFDTDKIVYSPSEDILATGGSAEDVLNNVPMVTVDQDGTVSLKGSSNLKVLVNGRENRYGDGGNDVDDIPASMIDKVEVITSPSAKYDPEGMAGIVNIILKKNRDKGFNAQVKVFTKQNKNHNFGDMGGISLNANYKKNKYNLYTSYSSKVSYRDRDGYRRSITTYTDDNGVLDDRVYESDFSWNSAKKKI